MKSIFKVDKKFIKELHKYLVNEEKIVFGVKSKSSLRDPTLIPTPSQIEEIILPMLWASMQLEEGRIPRFRVAYGPILPFEHLSLKFDFPGVSWSVEEIRKLAPAIVSPNGQINVYPFLNELQIWGIQTTTGDPKTIIFEVFEPGRIIVSSLISGKIAEISGQRADFINRDWQSLIFNLTSIREHYSGISVINDFLSLLYSTVTRRLLQEIRISGRGGTIIFVPESTKWKNSMEKPIFYKSLQPFNGIRQIENALQSELETVAASAKPGSVIDSILKKGTELMASPRYNEFISDAIKNMSSLTAVDGAAVISTDFDVLAFGTKVNIPQKTRKPEKITVITPFKDAKATESVLTFEFRGKRHLSAARFVNKHPESQAFVISQDGAISLFKAEKDSTTSEIKLLVYKGLELFLTGDKH